MSKFKVATLIERLDVRIAEKIAAATPAHERDVAEWEQKREAWLLKNKEPLLKFADVLKEKLRKDRPIQPADIPEGLNDRWGRFDLTLHNQEQRPQLKKADTRNLEQLKRTLQAVDGELISDAEMKRLGFERIGWLFA